MKELIEHIISSLVDEPDEVKVSEEKDETGTKFSIIVADADKGRVIGKAGVMVNAIRTILRGAAGKRREHCTIEIL